MSPEWIQWLQTGGGLAIAVWVIWLADNREKRSAKTFDDLNAKNQTIHEKTIERLTELGASNRALHDEIRSRPCVQEQWNGDERRHKERT
jgi:C4-dicarboxylate-specific signal transduction histidine kinase